MNQGPIEDQLAIRELIETSGEGVARMDSKLWGDTWAEDGVWEIDMMDAPLVGKSAALAVFEKLTGNMEFVSMTAYPRDIVIDGDTATARVYSQEIIFPKAGGTKILCGCFHDNYVKRDGRWYFLKRRFETLRRTPLVE